MNSWELSLGLVPIPEAWYRRRASLVEAKKMEPKVLSTEDIIDLRLAIRKIILEQNIVTVDTFLVIKLLYDTPFNELNTATVRNLTRSILKDIARGIPDELILELYDSGHTVVQIMRSTQMSSKLITSRLLLYGRKLGREKKQIGAVAPFSNEEMLVIRKKIREILEANKLECSDTKSILNELNKAGIASIDRLYGAINSIRIRVLSIKKHIKTGITDEAILDMYDSGMPILQIANKFGISDFGVNSILTLYGRK